MNVCGFMGGCYALITLMLLADLPGQSTTKRKGNGQNSWNDRPSGGLVVKQAPHGPFLKTGFFHYVFSLPNPEMIRKEVYSFLKKSFKEYRNIYAGLSYYV